MKKPLKRFLFIFCVILLLGGGAFIWFYRQAMLTDAAAAGNLTAVRIHSHPTTREHELSSL
jgi:hypothetical protein